MIKLIILLIIFMPHVQAYTKEDIISLTDNIETCSSETKSLVEGFKASYIRIINERNISDENLDIIYHTIEKAMSKVKDNNICSINQVNSELKKELYDLYKKANSIILNSPKIDNTTSDTKVVIDKNNKEIKIYDNGSLSDVVSVNKKLNYVGINKIVILSITSLIFLLLLLILLKILKKKNILIDALLYVVLILLPLNLIFMKEISIAIDFITLMNVEFKDNQKEVSIINKKIISYPLYGNKYAKIYIDNESEDIYFGDSTDILKKGIGQASSSYLPGEDAKTILSGHNTGIFKKLFDIKDQTIIIETTYGKFTYKVIDKEIILDTQIESLNKDYDLILYTCYPNSNLYGNKRLIVYANLIDSKWLGEIDE